MTEHAFFIEDLIENKKSFDHKIHSMLTINRKGFIGNIIDKLSLKFKFVYFIKLKKNKNINLY